MQKSLEFNIQLNAKDRSGRTAFHRVCCKGRSKIAEMLILKSAEFDIDLNPNQRGVFCLSTAWACIKVIHSIYLPCYSLFFIHIEPKLSKKEDDIFIYI